MEDLNTLQSWLNSLHDDVRTYLGLLEAEKFSIDIRRKAAGAINYLFKSIDLIPDGIDDIGYIDDVLTLRITASGIDAAEVEKADPGLAQEIKKLGEDCMHIKRILGGDVYERFVRFASGLTESSARGRSSLDIVSLPGKLNEVMTEAGSFCKEYTPPEIEQSERTLTKIKSFLNTRLPK